MADSQFREAFTFLNELGIFDVVLPFLLVFTIVFAILEKTKVLGQEEVNGQKLTKKNINSIVAFVIAFLVVASTQLVAVINEVMANIVLLLLISVSFLLLVGSFHTGDKEFSLENYPKWVKWFMIVMALGIVVIFLEALDWLIVVVGFFTLIDQTWAAAIIFIIVMLGFMIFITRDPKPKKAAE